MCLTSFNFHNEVLHFMAEKTKGQRLKKKNNNNKTSPVSHSSAKAKLEFRSHSLVVESRHISALTPDSPHLLRVTFSCRL